MKIWNEFRSNDFYFQTFHVTLGFIIHIVALCKIFSDLKQNSTSLAKNIENTHEQFHHINHMECKIKQAT